VTGAGGGSTTGTGGSTTGTGGSTTGTGGTGGCNCPTNEICQPGTTTCVCSQTDAEACASIACGTTTNSCNQTVQCPDTCPSGFICNTSTNSCTKLCTTGTGGIIISPVGSGGAVLESPDICTGPVN
jgi:hypothetical protein